MSNLGGRDFQRKSQTEDASHTSVADRPDHIYPATEHIYHWTTENRLRSREISISNKPDDCPESDLRIPQDTDIPAPVRTRMRLEDCSSAIAASISLYFSNLGRGGRLRAHLDRE
jgi:hypothetical protein